MVGGSQRTINTGGGDYAERDIDKRQGVIMSGGTIYGSVVGYNAGSVITNYGNSLPSNHSHSISQALIRIQHAVLQARQRNDEDLADDLEGVVRLIQAALKAQEEGKTERKLLKIQEAQEFLKRVNLVPLGLEHLMQMLDQLIL